MCSTLTLTRQCTHDPRMNHASIPTPHLEFIPSTQTQRQRWKNGAGWTREIRRHPTEAEAFDWRLSVADIENDGPFSAFPGYRRSLVLLKGHGIRLRFPDGHAHVLEPPHARIDFDGGSALQCQLLDGPTQDFNLMWRPSRVSAQMLQRAVAGSMRLNHPAADHSLIVHLLDGTLSITGTGLTVHAQAQDTIVLHPAHNDTPPIQLEGTAEILLIQIAAASAE